jgi:fluoride exporter
MNLSNILLVGAGGFFGSITRYITVRFVDRKLNSVFPYGTLTVNIAGSFILGLIIGMTMKTSSQDSNGRLFLTTGFCGGFTTFSAFSLDNINLLDQKLYGLSATYILASVGSSLLAAFTGIVVGKMLNQ